MEASNAQKTGRRAGAHRRELRARKAASKATLALRLGIAVAAAVVLTLALAGALQSNTAQLDGGLHARTPLHTGP